MSSGRRGVVTVPHPLVEVLRPYPIVFGNLSGLYDDDSVDLVSVTDHVNPTNDHGLVGVRLPLHVIAPYINTRIRHELCTLLRCTSFRPLPIQQLRSELSARCCASHCVELCVVFRRPTISRTNPFHIDRDEIALQRDAVPAVVSSDSSVPGVPTKPAVDASFPPAPLSLTDTASIVRDWCAAIS